MYNFYVSGPDFQKILKFVVPPVVGDHIAYNRKEYLVKKRIIDAGGPDKLNILIVK